MHIICSRLNHKHKHTRINTIGARKKQISEKIGERTKQTHQKMERKKNKTFKHEMHAMHWN